MQNIRFTDEYLDDLAVLMVSMFLAVIICFFVSIIGGETRNRVGIVEEDGTQGIVLNNTSIADKSAEPPSSSPMKAVIICLLLTAVALITCIFKAKKKRNEN